MIDRGFLSVIFDLLRWIFGHRPNGIGFEIVGNFIYSISERELIKFQLGMHRRYIAFKGLNDSYVNGVEFIKISDRSLHARFKRLQYNLKLICLNTLTFLRAIRGGNLLVAIIFKSNPNKETIQALEQDGFTFKKLKKNPYISI
tara:strand:- start:316 stop:747 length:432 start_codon:yes stop_codon:yes gene_type:complete